MGNTVREFADEDATVVVGTVIDMELQDELRVTVVATGLGSDKTAQKGEVAPVRLVETDKVVEDMPEPMPAAAAGGDRTDYRDMDRPTVIRKGQAEKARSFMSRAKESDLEYLDIPAFLRRQAD